MRTNEIKNEIDETKNWENNVKQTDLWFETNKYIFELKQFETVSSLLAIVFVMVKLIQKKQRWNKPIC